MKRLGIIGGMGPMATAYFFQLIVEMTDAQTDQEHIDILIHNCPSIPDRTNYILNRSNESPKEPIISIGRKLKEDGLDVLAIPCITAHFFHQELEEQIGMPIIHAVRETAKYLQQHKYERVGIMATDATMEKQIFQSELDRYGMQSVIPSADGQKDVMHLIYGNVKSGREIDMEAFDRVSEELYAKGAQVILLGCTELSMIKSKGAIGSGYLDVMEVLAKCCVEQCGTLKKGYKELLMGDAEHAK